MPRGAGTVIPNHCLGMRGGSSSGSETLVVWGLGIGKFSEGDQMRVIAEKMLASECDGGRCWRDGRDDIAAKRIADV